MNPGQLRQLMVGFLAGPLLAGAGYAEPMYRDYDVFIEYANVYNDRIGYSRFFAGANTDVLRVSAFVWPSPDSDARDFVLGGQAYRSTNGAETTVTLTHSSSEGFARGLTFVGLESGGGGALNEYTTILGLANPYVQSQLQAWSATPFTLTAENPDAPNGQVSYTLPDYDSTVLLPFLTDVAVTGGGLTPTISWVVPDTDAPVTNALIQIRLLQEVDGQLAARLVHMESINLGATNFTIEELNRADLFALDPNLQLGSNYEIAVILEQRDENGRLMGRARTFFEFVPMEEDFGAAIYLPSVGPDGVFRFDVKVEEGELIYIDPVVAIGYDYQIGESDPMFASVILPDVGDGLYELWLFDLVLNDFVFEQELIAGVEHFFSGGGVDRFRILGIEASAGLDPGDVTAFVTGLTFTGDGRFTGTMTPITLEISAVPEPPVLALIGLALLAVGMMGRFRRTVGA